MSADSSFPFRVHQIQNRDELIQVLGIASELEHNLMCQYLFAAYSLKRYTGEGLTLAQLDRARGWGGLVTLVARQEMEHLGLVMNLRSAIGASPYFKRPNFPQKRDYYGHANVDTVLTRFSADTIRRFQKFEQPHPAPDQHWCEMSVAEVAVYREQNQARWRSAAALERLPIRPFDFRFDSVQSLYESIRRAFETLPDLFIGPASAQIYGGPGSPYSGEMDDLNQYDIDLIQVKNRDTALQAIEIILEQGEGIQAPPDYVKRTHYCSFTSILNELANADFDAARPVVNNPLTVMHADISAPDEVHLITNEDTLEVAVIFNRCYELMLVMLLYLYGGSWRHPKRNLDFMNAIFFPLMTMFIRPLAEILTQLPAFPDRPGNAGPGFEIPNEIVVLPEYSALWKSIQERFDSLARDLGRLRILGKKQDYLAIVTRLEYTQENMRRLAEDWRTHWKDVGTTGSH